MEQQAITVQDALRQTRFADGFSDQQLNTVAKASEFLSVSKGQRLFSEGTMEDQVFIVLSGHVALEMLVPRRGNVRLLTVSSGELVGWSGLIGNGQMTATAVTTEDCQLIGISSRIMRDLCQKDHELGYILMTRTANAIAHRLVATRLQLLDLFYETEPQSLRRLS